MALCTGQIFDKSLSGAVAGSFVGIPSVSHLSQDTRADLRRT